MKRADWACLGFFLMAALVSPSNLRAAEGFYLSTGLAGWAIPVGIPSGYNEYCGNSDYSLELIDLGYGITKNLAAGGYFGGSFSTAMCAGWSHGYGGVYGRYSFDQGTRNVPYLDLGLGIGTWSSGGEGNPKLKINTGLSLKAGLGWEIFLGKKQRFYVAPEISYQLISSGNAEAYDENEFRLDDINANISLVQLLFKIGYHWKK